MHHHLHDPAFSHFGKTSICVRRRDRQRAIAHTALAHHHTAKILHTL